jgi:outer membrane protein assembly factor BamB
MFRGDAKNNGSCIDCGNLFWESRWRVELGERIDASPLIDSQRRVIVATRKGLVAAFDGATGERVAGTRLDAGVWSTPALFGDLLLALTSAGTLYGLHRDDLRTLYQSSGFARSSSAITVSANEALFCNGKDLVAVALATGALRYRVELGGTCFTAPAIGDDGMIVVGDRSGHVYGIRDRKIRWRYQTGDHVDGSAAIYRGRAFVGGNAKAVHAIDLASGRLLWKTLRSNWVVSTPLVSDQVYAGDDGGTLSALSLTYGKERWTVKAGDDIASSATIVRDQLVFAAHDGKVYQRRLGRDVFRDSGYLAPPFDLGAPIFASIAVSRDDFIAVAAQNGVVLAIK